MSEFRNFGFGLVWFLVYKDVVFPPRFSFCDYFPSLSTSLYLWIPLCG